MRYIVKIYNSFLYYKYSKETKIIKNIIKKTEKKHHLYISNNEFLKEFLNNKDKYSKIAAAYFILKKYTGKSLYDVQIMAILAMYDGCFVDVKTGEGKTLIIGAYCLVAKKPIHVVTVNNYLAEEAIRQLGKMYSAFNISYDILTEKTFMNQIDMKKDVIYGTAAVFAFKYIVKRYERDIDYELNTAVIDEADYVLIDNATSSFTVGVGEKEIDKLTYEKQHQLAKFAKKINKIFAEANIVTINSDEVVAWTSLENNFTNTIFINKPLRFIDFTQDIQDYVLSISQEYGLETSNALSFMFGIARAYHIYEKNVDYVVFDNKVVLVDRHNGRLLPNSRHDFYLHSALLLKETAFEAEKTKTIGKIANQVYFLKYKNIIGLSGSLVPVMREISDIFKTSVVEIPKNKPSIINKKYYLVDNKNTQLLNIAKDNLEKGKATLIICKNDKDANEVSKTLKENGYENTLFNNNTSCLKKEEDVVCNAGKNKKITISTLLFGRGTDIIPDNNSTILSVVIYEPFGCERANIQISGRTGRQGREGDIHILVSPQDEIFQYVDCKTKAKINEKNFMHAIKKAITNIYCREKASREYSTFFAYYMDMIFENYYKVIQEEKYDDFFLSHMENIELISLNLSKREDTARLIMKEAKKVIDTVTYYIKKE